MSQRWRADHPGAWHHVMNRGLARRAVFEDRECVRYFLSCLARTVRAGLIEVHAYCLMTNHFHLLVRSPTGQLADAMRLVQNRYVRWFNRRSLRDGPLFRGRFRSRPVESLAYRRQLVAYIDSNPVAAGLVPVPELYPHGSASRYMRPHGPRWLQRDWVEGEAESLAGDSSFTPDSYRRAFGRPQSEFERALVDARLASSSRDPDPLDELVAAAPAGVLRWLQNKARNADGRGIVLPCAPADRVQQATEEWAGRDPEWTLLRGTKRIAVWPPLTVGLLRDLAGASWREVQQRTGLGEGAARRAYEAHRVWVRAEERYGEALAEIGARAVRG
jgi:REP element-mobilizing transposase RayT